MRDFLKVKCISGALVPSFPGGVVRDKVRGTPISAVPRGHAIEKICREYFSPSTDTKYAKKMFYVLFSGSAGESFF